MVNPLSTRLVESSNWRDGFHQAIANESPWSLVFQDHTHYFSPFSAPRGQPHLNAIVMARARQEFFQRRTAHWRGRLLLLFANVELGTATVGAIPSKPKVMSEVIPRGYRASQLLTAAFHRPGLLPSAILTQLAQHQSLVIPIAVTMPPALGSKIIVFRTVSGGPILILQLCLVALVAIALGLLCGRVTSNAELEVAVAEAWIQFAQVVAASRRH